MRRVEGDMPVNDEFAIQAGETQTDGMADGTSDPEKRRIELMVNGVSWRAKVDTEAEVSVLSEATAEALGLAVRPSEISTIRGVGGSCNPVGQAETKLTANGLELDKVKMTILPQGALNTGEILLGTDLIDSRNLTAVFSKGKAWLLEDRDFEEVAKLLPQQDKKVQLKLKSEVKLEPNSVAFVETAPMQGNLEAKSGTIMMGRRSKKADLGVSCELQENGDAIPVANPGRSEIILREGTVIARG